MIFVVAALHCEAKPIIDKFKLKKKSVYSKLELFENDEIRLIVSGIGKIRSAIATTLLLSQSKLSSDSVVVNIGCCGSARDDMMIGELVFINKITDKANGRDYFPDPILRHGLKEAAMVTHDVPVEKNKIDQPEGDLVDMEASGFFQAASMFVDHHRIYCFKIVSDFLELSTLSKEFISGLIEKKMEAIDHIFSMFPGLHEKETEVFQAQEIELLRRVGGILKLTQSQKHQFVELVRSAKVRNRNVMEKLSECSAWEIKSKSENKDAFERIRKILSQ
ncbi:hypothetical protein JNM05_10880 [bacterium]|nr:hypothetical protein [bacterium]